MGRFWTNGWNITKFLFIYLHLFSWTHLQERPVDACRLKRRGLAQRCAFCGFAPRFGGEIPPNLNFWGVSRRFQAKRTKYWKFHVIETTASILAKFGTTIETIKWSSRVVPIGTQQIQDGGQPPFWKKVKSPYLCEHSTDFDEIWRGDAYRPLTADLPLKFWMPPSWKNYKNRDISATVWQIFMKFGTLVQNGPLNLSDR